MAKTKPSKRVPLHLAGRDRRRESARERPSGAALVDSLLRRYRFESFGVAAIALFTALVLAWPILSPQAPEAPRPIPTPRPTSTPGAIQTGNLSDTERRPPRITAEQAINHIKAQPYRGIAYTSRAGYSENWSAEYRGDGTWWVRAGDATWLLFDDSLTYMPANLAAVQLEGGPRRTAK